MKAYPKTGHNRYAAATGPMAEELSPGSSHMTDADVEAIATFLKSVGGGAKTKVAAAASSGQMRAGKAIYRDVCSACHGLDGKGVAGLYPGLASAPSVRAADPRNLIRVVLRGARSVATDQTPTAPAMPAFAWQLSDDQIAAVLTYLRNEGTARANPIEAARVRSERAALALRNN
jgi:mono/diheme cytochrome c family protein